MTTTQFRSLLSSRWSAATAAAAATTLLASHNLWREQETTATRCSDDAVPPTNHPWRHTGIFRSYDHAALRRGFQVYREVCATCHSLKRIHYRDLLHVTHTKDDLKLLAKQADIVDGPNEEGEMFERPGKFIDFLPKPYANDQVGMLANNGALPPDLTSMTLARENGLNYVFSLLTGYGEPPAGKSIAPGLHYNYYFHGGAIAMAPPLTDGQVEYEDGTEATVSQMARDVVQFLDFCAQPEMEARKRESMIVAPLLFFFVMMTGYAKRRKFSIFKTRHITYYDPNGSYLQAAKPYQPMRSYTTLTQTKSPP